MNGNSLLFFAYKYCRIFFSGKIEMRVYKASQRYAHFALRSGHFCMLKTTKRIRMHFVLNWGYECVFHIFYGVEYLFIHIEKAI